MTTRPRIFVAIPSFRDSETQWTVKDLFAKALYPERIFVGICWQFDPDEDLECFKEPYLYPQQVRARNVFYKDSGGLGWARAQAAELWQGEEYTLQIDSHMRFEPGWDESLITMLARCPTPKAVLSTYVPLYTPPDTRDHHEGEILRTRLEMFAEIGNPQIIHQTCTHVPLSDTERSGLYRAPLPIGNFLFCPAQVMKDIPLDPHIRFWGEEITYGARLWTHGWDIYQPDQVVAYHYWRRPMPKGAPGYRRVDNAASTKVYRRIRHLLELEPSKDSTAIVDIEKYGLGKERALDDLWKMAGIDWKKRNLSNDAKLGRWNEVSGVRCQVPDKKKFVSDTRHPSPVTLPRIFVNIASYRDVECQWTVKDLFEKAAHPERIFVGICWQFDPKEDEHCFEVVTRPDQVRIYPINWRQAQGVCWARHETQLLHEGEEYTLMIDSHMRFVEGWDELMIAELALCDAAKPLLSCSPVPYTPPDKLGTNMNPTFRRVKPFMSDGNIRCQGEAFDGPLPKPIRGMFLVANFVFSRSNIIEEVPYDPYLYFDQEEITYALRLYTHGWEIFSPRTQFLYHYYNDGKQSRPLHWRDVHKENTQHIHFLRNRGLARFNHITEYKISSDPAVIKDLDKYGLGTVHTLSEFEAVTGIDFKRKIASDKAMRGLFIENLQRYRKHPVRVPEIDDAPKPPPPSTVRKGMLEPGDAIPMFVATDTNQKLRAVELYGGRHVLLAFLPAANKDYCERFFRELHGHFQVSPRRDAWQIFTLDDTVENLIQMKASLDVKHELWADADRSIARGFGTLKDGQYAPCVFILNPNLRVEHVYSGMDAPALATAAFTALKIVADMHLKKSQERRVISETVPGIIVPNVFSPEFCAHCIQAFRTGKTFEGTVGAGDQKAYRPDTKVRTDFIVGGTLLEEIDDKLSRSLLPEIEKVFGFEVTYRELYKIGMYSGEKKGFFKQHRDNTEAPLGYRRIAVTIQLNDDYEGGGLHFPEYDNHIYRPKMGAAIAFPCSVLHEALPVKTGERYVVVAFFHGTEDEAYRRSYQESIGESLKPEDFTFKSRYQTPGLAKTRDFYKEWWEKKVKIGGFKE